MKDYLFCLFLWPLTSFSRDMKKLNLTVLLCFCVNAYAFNWVEVIDVRKGLDRIYVDFKSLKKEINLFTSGSCQLTGL